MPIIGCPLMVSPAAISAGGWPGSTTSFAKFDRPGADRGAEGPARRGQVGPHDTREA